MMANSASIRYRMAGNVTLKRVLGKLYKLHRQGADFVNTRWWFDWDDTSSLATNTCMAELTALTTLGNAGVIAFSKKSTNGGRLPYGAKSQHLLNQHGVYLTPDGDQASRHFEWAVWLIGFNYEQFMAECKAIGFDPSAVGITAALSFASISTPQVTIDGVSYSLSPLSDSGVPFRIVDYCLTQKPNQPVSLGELKDGLPLSGVSNINQALKNSCFDRNTGVLKGFITSAPHTITVSAATNLSETAKRAIILAARQTT